ncbi:hypothetical protein KP77_27290 [Jeotgalibacillus alimentarius]|uniref:Uncharacterized protein n=1 Tax=Jeotgalibacillus alimentarius TaxID=135826 RepID=A0A0C2VCE0_9BACL|nr:hypothetical protein KP77_27290 [Jeotgalibacillus alimentarius]
MNRSKKTVHAESVPPAAEINSHLYQSYYIKKYDQFYINF